MGCLLCEWMWIFSVRLCRCRVLEETVTAGIVSLMLGGGFCGFGCIVYIPKNKEKGPE